MGRGLIEKRKHMQRHPFQFHSTKTAYSVLATVSSRYPQLPGRLSTRYSPVRHFTRSRRNFHVRLACVRHAASVQSEPESNSPVKVFDSTQPRLASESNDRTQSSFSQLALHLSKNRDYGRWLPPRRSGEVDLCLLSPPLSIDFLIFFDLFGAETF